jgi:KipI family sensor histidine kinase inhibitor
VQDIIPAARTVLVRFDAQSATRQQVSSWIEAAHQIEAPAAAPPPTVRVPVRYDGADLAAVAQLACLSVDQVVAQHSAVEYTAAFCGFAPGFAYLTGVPTALRVPRRATPRTTVPAGAVALADEFTAVYPRASPGGWQLIGSTDLPMFDVDREPPALLSPGTRVLFLPTR